MKITKFKCQYCNRDPKPAEPLRAPKTRNGRVPKPAPDCIYCGDTGFLVRSLDEYPERSERMSKIGTEQGNWNAMKARAKRRMQLSK